MANLGKKILSAFVEVNDNKKTETEKNTTEAMTTFTGKTANNSYTTQENSSKFKEHFEKLFRESNMPSPSYFEYSKMLAAMHTVPDEHIRFITAFAGLSVQGLDKQTLLSTAAQYLQLLETDAQHFQHSVDAALKEKVATKKQQLDEKEKRIQLLMQEISTLQNDLLSTQAEIKENEARIEANMAGYNYESEDLKKSITRDIEKIKSYIQ
ncbi:hypothetical protein A4H97_05270 [Niastella yeongjuensis]|uniref:Uncharacterized protein n=1 Tax=Niastella yeongjuensis TaxID=354355 RepID=A0A1V9ELI2_9BACT|nr:hypothetical protein [Niastella yeongjuensis]OQP46931.1 hypothetical protein A4H97_05270 [Niastella yeongjuensis]SEN61171.1 hypothetical protein SAMN05660816_01077 [Niastella yeongjuensis]